MCVILISVGALAYGQYLTESYIDARDPIGGLYVGPWPPNHNPELLSRGEWLESASPYAIQFGCVIMAIGLVDIWYDLRTTTQPEKSIN